GRYCMLSNGNCMVRCGDTAVMVNVTMASEPRPGIDFFPLGVDYEEKLYTVGKIPGGWKRREGRATDKAILVSRLIDRPLRPLFPKGFYNDVSVVCTPMSVDPDISPEVLSMLGSSIALSISDIPFEGPTGAVNIGLINGKFIINPNQAEQEVSELDLTVSGTKEAVLMVEAGAQQVSEDTMLDAIMFAHEEIKKQVAWIESIVAEVGKPKSTRVGLVLPPEDLTQDVRAFAYDKMVDALKNFDKEAREIAISDLTKATLEEFKEKYPEGAGHIKNVLFAIEKEIIRHKIIFDGVRPDGRSVEQVRPIWCDHGVLPRVHGSGVFTRGLTQVCTTLTLGMISEAQELEGLDDEDTKRYMHHYNMPPYSTGEAKPLRAPGRREIGHGALAERALLPVIPTVEEFPYTIRLVSEVLSSNGSTSQASVCGSTLALMDAGVPISSPVAGIAMGLMKDKETGKVVVLTDIQGLEDFTGDMDFKVAGTERGITAIQMDMKIHGIDRDILKTALEHARVGRMHIMNKMLECLPQPAESLSPYAPKIITFNIDPDKIREVIGSGGKTINEIIDKTGVKIDIEDDGKVFISSSKEDMIAEARRIIEGICMEFEMDKEYVGKVVRIMQFGAFVEVVSGKDGMIHISKLSDKRVEKVEDVVNIGDTVKVKVIKIDDRGRVDFRLIEKL
ncbi:MAG: polyribonucleotide nucleotidyltransferase, partial [Clostridia bacterium]